MRSTEVARETLSAAGADLTARRQFTPPGPHLSSEKQLSNVVRRWSTPSVWGVRPAAQPAGPRLLVHGLERLLD